MSQGTATATYRLTGATRGSKVPLGVANGTHAWTATGYGASRHHGTGTAPYRFAAHESTGNNGIYWPDDRFRVIVQEARGVGGAPGEILTRDMTVSKLMVSRQLSGPCDIGCDVDFHDMSVAGIYFKPWGHYIHLEKAMMGKRRIFATGIVQPSDTDPHTGVLHLKAKGFSCYPKGIPWLEDISWKANDAYDPVTEIWNYLQSQPGGDLGVEVYPSKSGVEMLPGYSYDGTNLDWNFQATFVRATDKLDCGDYIDALAKDTPFDYAEISQWNADRSDVIKKIHLGYPRLGAIQQTAVFVINENVLAATPNTESDIDWISDIIVNGWFPSKENSATLANADPTRLRRVLNEQDVSIDSNERAAAWARRKLARRQTPAYWKTITIDPSHPNAPLGSFDVGDTITVSGFMPWVGYISQEHKIMAISVQEEKNVCDLTLKAEGEFNYDPIFFPDGSSNILSNPGFDNDLAGWTPSGAGWGWDGAQGNTALGAATITADGAQHDLISGQYGIDATSPPNIPYAAYVKGGDLVSTGNTIQLIAQYYVDNVPSTQRIIDELPALSGLLPWHKLAGSAFAPFDTTQVALMIRVLPGLSAGKLWFDDAELTL